ncbi:MAG TPA: F0F1 ATP synthase subunit B, partial [Thermoanaerobaculia bacterium]|nr:F0F1 ATP synthase subunit B [Thermoanaerobaculia bacterium]
AWNPLQGDFGNFFWTVVVLLLVFWVLSKYAWGPVLSGLQGREDFIRRSLEQARGERDEAHRLLGEYEAKLAAARGEIEAMIEEARRDAAVLREREEAAAKDEARQILDRARREIDLARDNAVAELYRRTTDLATLAAGRILERELQPADHERLIAESIAAVEESARGGRRGGAPAAH